MPELSFNDVFSPEKREVLGMVKHLEEANRVYGVFVAYWMHKNNLKVFRISRQDFNNMINQNGETASINARMLDEDTLEYSFENDDNPYS